METLKELSVEHPYYASDSNYYSNEASSEFETMTDFLAEYKDADVDMNLVYRWDIKPRDEENTETGRYYAEVFIIGQRKGLYKPNYIKHVNEEEAKQFLEYLKPHWERLTEMWKPVSNQ